ncbi:MAG: hypothetical protein LBB15_01300 [Puniceicoccales bacterium]|jgi:hypothetical protein|nr:hypothetical protein [Puniceicoccales bacterium]
MNFILSVTSAANDAIFMARSAVFYASKKNEIDALKNDARLLAIELKCECGRNKFDSSLDRAKSPVQKAVEVVLNPQSKGGDIDKCGRDISKIFLTLTSDSGKKAEIKSLLERGIAVVKQFNHSVVEGHTRSSENINRIVNGEINSGFEQVKKW